VLDEVSFTTNLERSNDATPYSVLPLVEKAATGYMDAHHDWSRGLSLVSAAGMDIDDNPEIVRQFMTKEGYSFPAAMTNSSVTNAFGSISRVPISYLVDKHGVIRKKITGQAHHAGLQELVTPLLNE
jgi:hypothetical protein